MDLEFVINHIRNREYMSGIERDAIRVKETQECFTETWLVRKKLGEYEKRNPEIFSNGTKTWIDNSCGDGQWLGEVLIRKVENGIDFETALSSIYGIDLMPDNCELCRDRLLCGREDLRHIVERNIVFHDALTYAYEFNGTNKNNDELAFDSLFD
tara:strand:+ start:121 stop:585 length:465 start_codon:yes stop_codon:yes gene_type:complete